MRSFTGMRGIDARRLRGLIDAARVLRDEVASGEGYFLRLRGRAVGLLFYEPSTRTRFSFEMACHRLGAHPLSFSAGTSSATKGENIVDSARVLKAVGADALVIRHKEIGVPTQVAEALGIPVISAGDGTNEHPTQALLDLVTIRDHFDAFDGLTVGIAGDIRHSRVARSNAIGLRALGARVLLAGPAELQDTSLVELGCEQQPTLEALLEQADVVMMLRIQRERLGATRVDPAEAYRQRWGLTVERGEALRDQAIVMHPGPMNRGVEIDDAVADGPKSVVYDQMVNGVFARMAVLMDALDPNFLETSP